MSYDFTIDGYDDPGPDVLDNGLPDLPAELEVDHGVAVARWVDGDFGVVVVVQRHASEDMEEGDDEYHYDVQPYLRVDGEWEPTNGSGGSNWYSPPFERHPTLTRFAVSGGHVHQQGGDAASIRVVDGVAGEGVVTIEVVTGGRTAKMLIESPIGAWVAGVVGDEPAQWIARDAEGRIAGSGDIDPVDFGMPAWVQERMSEVGQSQTESNEDGNFQTGLWIVEQDELPADLAAWFQQRENGGRNLNEKYIQSERVPPWQRLADDLRATTGRELEVRAYSSTNMPDAIEYEVWLDGVLHSSHGRGFDESDPEGFLADFTDLLCEQVLHEEIWGGWPTCPVHKTHPLDPNGDIDGAAAWACPKSAVTIRIGDLTKEALAHAARRNS